MTGFISEALASIKENLKQKRKSPLYGAFAFSWLAFNWKPVSIFFLSKENIYALINNVSAYTSWKNQLLYPVLVAVILIIIVPAFHAFYAFFDAWVGSIHDSADSIGERFKQNRITKAKTATIDAEMELTLAGARKAAEVAREQEAEAESLLRAKKMQSEIESIDDLKEKLQEARNKIEEMEIQKSFAQNAIGNPGFRKD